MKNTRLVYNDEKNLKIYQALSPEDFKEFFMTYLTYKPGSELQITDFNNPLLYALFLSFKDKIDYNEEKWERQAAAKRENGKKGGRPKKSVITEVENNEFQVEQNTTDLSYSNNEEVEQPQPIRDNATEEPKTPNKDITHMTKPNDMDNMETTYISTDDIEEKFETDEQKYGSRVMDFVDRYYDILENIVKAKVINTLTPTAETILVSQSADIKLKDLVIEYGFTDNEKPYLIQLLNDWRDETINKQKEVVAA